MLSLGSRASLTFTYYLGRGVKKSNQIQENETEPKKMKADNTMTASRMDEFEALNYCPLMSVEDQAAAELELQNAPKELNFDQAYKLFLATRVLQRDMIKNPIKEKIHQQFKIFTWLNYVSCF